MWKRTLALAAAAVLSGCATHQVRSGDADTVLEEEIPAGFESTQGLISIIRDGGWMGAACSVHVLVDGADVAKLRPGQRAVVVADAGPRIVTAEAGGICGGGSENLQVTVQPGQTQYVRVAAGQSGDLKIQPAAPGFR